MSKGLPRDTIASPQYCEMCSDGFMIFSFCPYSSRLKQIRNLASAWYVELSCPRHSLVKLGCSFHWQSVCLCAPHLRFGIFLLTWAHAFLSLSTRFQEYFHLSWTRFWFGQLQCNTILRFVLGFCCMSVWNDVGVVFLRRYKRRSNDKYVPTSEG